MRLSMWVLADWMETDGLRVDIQDGSRELRNVRLLPSSDELSRSTVYLDADESGNILCTCGRDLIVVPDSDIDAVFNGILDCFEHYNDIDMKLRNLAVDGAEVSEVLDEAGRSLGQYFVVADATYFLHAWGGDESRLGGDEAALGSIRNRTMPLPAIMHVNKMQGIRTRGRESYLVDIPPIDSMAAVTNLFDGDRHEGWLVAVGRRPGFSRGELHVQDALAPIVMQALRQHADRDLRMDRAAVLADLLESGADGQEMADTRLASLGWNRDDPKCIYAVRQYDPSKNPSHVVGRFLERIDPTLVLVNYGGETLLFANLLLVNEGQLKDAMQPILSACGCAAGKSPWFYDTGLAARNAHAARVAAQQADARRLIVEFEEIKLDYALSTLRDGVIADVRHGAVDLIACYDEQHGTQLLDTLRVYLKCACSATAASKELFVHRSTLLYRLERIEEVGEVDLADSATRFHLELSLRLGALSA